MRDWVKSLRRGGRGARLGKPLWRGVRDARLGKIPLEMSQGCQAGQTSPERDSGCSRLGKPLWRGARYARLSKIPSGERLGGARLGKPPEQHIPGFVDAVQFQAGVSPCKSLLCLFLPFSSCVCLHSKLQTFEGVLPYFKAPADFGLMERPWDR